MEGAPDAALQLASGSWGVYSLFVSEASAQASLTTSLRATGCRVQKFTDQFGIGIPDLLVGIPGAGMWLELKYIDRWPVKPTTPVLARGLTGNQKAWAREWDGRPLPCGVLVVVGDGSWLLVPASRLSDLTDGPSEAMAPLLQRQPITRLAYYHLDRAMKQALGEKCDG